ncbi:hypothetical protein [Winogradskyella sp.]|uniref:hypothetical protein n=1 Tax=Winogradskyella sp. TaxID=1883156 RepID=UPI00260AE2FC|nr:hypothetical protein [Winogradskyella sp.]
MKDKLISYLKFGNRFCGVEHTHTHGKEIFYGLVLKKKNKQLDIEKSFEIPSFEDLKTSIPKGKPIHLVINTKAVLTKLIEDKSKDMEKLTYKAFPNIKIEDFYYEVIQQETYQVVSICRKSHVNDLLEKYALNGITIIDFSLGNILCSTILQFIKLKTIKSSNAFISLEENKITNIITDDLKNGLKYDINGLTIKNTELLSFAAALNLMIKDQAFQSSFLDKKNALNIEFNQKLFTNQFLKMGLSVLFLVLLINFLFFNHYYKEVNSLKETAQVLEASKVKMINLNEKVQKSEKMVNDVLTGSSSKSSFYAHVIINHLPESILLEEFNYQPLTKKIKDGKSIENHKNTIVISGHTKARVLFSQWISQLETIPWISSVNIVSFEDINKASSKFTLKLQINDDTKN